MEIKKCVGPSLFGYTIVFTRWQVDDTADTAKPTTATANISDIKSTSTSKDTTITTHSSPNTTNKEMGTTIVTDEILTKVTLDADNLATRYIGTFLLPIAASMIIRSLIIDKHASWYSWGIGALTGFVYTFGFVMMCPQLFINYKLKSVAALPWKFLIYKFLNTFIDGIYNYFYIFSVIFI